MLTRGGISAKVTQLTMEFRKNILRQFNVSDLPVPAFPQLPFRKHSAMLFPLALRWPSPCSPFKFLQTAKARHQLCNISVKRLFWTSAEKKAAFCREKSYLAWKSKSFTLILRLEESLANSVEIINNTSEAFWIIESKYSFWSYSHSYKICFPLLLELWK